MRKRSLIKIALLYSLFTLSLSTAALSAAEREANIAIDTKFGTIEIRLLPYVAPNHVKTFIHMVKLGFYDGTIFHRVIPGFMIQGGDPNTLKGDKSTYGQGGPGFSQKAEFNNQPHIRGTVSMARGAGDDSAGSQFFIVTKSSRFLDKKYTVFGRVTKGMNVADKIASQKRDKNDLPLERIEMRIRVLDDSVLEKIKK
ncbi:MAG: peptidylprolyl isomerase [Gammaproteobacteria bacterium]|jgi:peptidyl-prolyl cis-trans isomerase B (cyclophilin B)|nr:peptidylprolyl isomerase [Gammaproteobacteria bacterium]